MKKEFKSLHGTAIELERLESLLQETEKTFELWKSLGNEGDETVLRNVFLSEAGHLDAEAIASLKEDIMIAKLGKKYE